MAVGGKQTSEMGGELPAQSFEGGTIAEPVSYATIKAAFDALVNAPPRRCEYHVVHPKVYRRGGWTNCANCGKAVFCGGD